MNEVDILLRAKDEASATIDRVNRSLGDVDDAAGRATKGTSAFSSILGGIGAGIGLAAVNVLTNAAGALVNFAVGSIEAASTLDESINKINVVFGEQADAILLWSKNSDTALGQSEQQALEAAGTFGNLFDAIGLSEDATAEMSIDLVELASDLASFNNIDPTVALEKLRAGIIGETEPLRTLGVNLTAATVEAKALEMGLADTGKELTEQDKIMARYALILEQTTNAQGDFARTSDGLANSQRIFNAQMANLSATLGEAFLPIVNEALAVLVDFMPTVVAAAEGLGSWVTKLRADMPIAADAVTQGGTDILKWFETEFPDATKAGQEAFDKVTKELKELWDAWAKAFEGTAKDVGEALKELEKWWDEHGEKVMKIIDNTFDTVVTVITAALDIIVNLITLALQLISGDWEGAWQTIQEITETVLDTLQTVIGNQLDSLWQMIGLVLDSVSADWGATWDGLRTSVDTALANVQTAVSTQFNALLAQIEGLFGGLYTRFHDYGANIVRGFTDGIGSLIGTAQAKITELANLVAQAAAAALGIQSESKVFRYLGKQVGEGFKLGIIESTRGLSGLTAQSAISSALSYTTNNNFAINMQGSGSPSNDIYSTVSILQMMYATP